MTDREAIRAILAAIEGAWRHGPADAIARTVDPYALSRER